MSVLGLGPKGEQMHMLECCEITNAQTVEMAERHLKNPEHVAAGYKATIHNPHVSKKAYDHVWDELHKMGIHNIDQPTHHVPRSRSRSPTKKESEGQQAKNEGNVIGGLIETLKNPYVSEVAKQHAGVSFRSAALTLSHMRRRFETYD
ncbi:Conidiation-specific protein 6 [Leucoagaricus sp. SymC.cos]|nr:Conidiation-specific protein 6 [Leucoagaricus sp. SymC.cos]